MQKMPALQSTLLFLLLLRGSRGSSGLTPMSQSELEHVVQILCITQCPPDTYCVLVGAKIITRFTAPDLDTCKMFCWYTENCQSFSYKTRSNLCGLYSNFPTFKLDYELPYQPSDFKSMAATFNSLGDMDCVINYESNPSVPCRSINEILKASTTLNGILIMHVFSGLCLDFGKALILDWKDCPSAILWRLQQIPVSNGVLLDENSVALKFVKADSPSECMTATRTGKRKVVVVGLCKEGRADQIFEVSKGSLDGLRGSTATLSVNECYFSFTNQDTNLYTAESETNGDVSGLSLVSMLLPTEYRSLCSRETFQERSGGLVDGTTPFFLPGSTISVTCQPGFGFRELDFVSTLNVTCMNEETYFELPTCTELDVQVSSGDDDISVAIVDDLKVFTSSLESDTSSSASFQLSSSSPSSSSSSRASSSDSSVAMISKASSTPGKVTSGKKAPKNKTRKENTSGKSQLYLTVSSIGNFGQLILLLVMGAAIFALVHKVASLKAGQSSTEKDIAGVKESADPDPASSVTQT